MDERYEQIGTFIAHSTDDGTKYTIIVETRVVRYGSDRGAQKVDGTRRLKTSHGEFVRQVGEGKYQIVRAFTKIDLTSDDPNAP